VTSTPASPETDAADARAPVAALTMLRDDAVFLRIWVRHHAAAFGAENLFVILDGQDQTVPPGLGPVNVIRVPHVPSDRTRGDRARARLLSQVASGLLLHYRRVVASDVDELLCLDPRAGDSLSAYLLAGMRHAAVSAVGLDVGEHPDHEAALDFDAPVLRQRAHARLSSRYTKPVVCRRPVRWGSGLHRVKGRGLHIDPNLLLFHIGLVDRDLAAAKAGRAGLRASGWEAHFERRFELYDAMRRYRAQDFDALMPRALARMRWLRPIYALNKPGTLPADMIVRLPERLRGLF